MTPDQHTAICHILQTCPPWPVREKLDEHWGTLYDAIKKDVGNYVYAIVSNRFTDAQTILLQWDWFLEQTNSKPKENRSNVNQMINVYQYFFMAPVVWGQVHGNA